MRGKTRDKHLSGRFSPTFHLLQEADTTFIPPQKALESRNVNVLMRCS